MPTNNINLTAPTEDSVNALELQRRMALADQLRQASMQSPNNEMVGGVVVKQSPFQGLGRLAQALMAKKMNEENDAKMQQMAALQQQRRQTALDGMGDIDPTIKAALGSSDPFIQQLAKYQLEAKQKAADKQAELAQKATDAKALQAERLAAQAEQAKRDEALRRDLATQHDSTIRAVAATKDGAMKPPPGYRWTKDGNQEVIPGGPADTKKQGAYNADMGSMQGATNAMDRLAEAANALKMHPGLKSITGLRGAIPNVPGTNAADAEAMLTTLKSQVAFGVLQAMRDASKTGGALGAVSEKELKLLEGNLAALEKAQSYEQFSKSLDNIIRYTEESKGRIRNAFNMKHGEQQPTQPKNVTVDW